MMRELLVRLLELERDLDVVAQVSCGDRVLAAARESRADVALLDIKMPGSDGLAVAEDVARALPPTARPSATWLAACISRRAPYATTSLPRSRAPAPETAWRQCESHSNTTGCETPL